MDLWSAGCTIVGGEIATAKSIFGEAVYPNQSQEGCYILIPRSHEYNNEITMLSCGKVSSLGSYSLCLQLP